MVYNTTDEAFKGGLACGAMLGGIAGIALMLFVVNVTEGTWQRDAVRHGAAEYDTKTGEWRWKTELQAEAQ